MNICKTTWQAVCQWCGQRGSRLGQNYDHPPIAQPVVAGRCKSHPSGKPNMPHNPRWEKV